MPVEEQIGVLVDLQSEGKIRHIGLSEISVDELRTAQAITSIATVQNRYNLIDRASEALVDVCDDEGIGFIPWFPIATGELAKDGGPLAALADGQTARPRAAALLLGAFTAAGALLALVGLFSVVDYFAVHRRGEFALRLAVGARARDLGRLVVGDATRLALLGGGIGAGIALFKCEGPSAAAPSAKRGSTESSNAPAPSPPPPARASSAPSPASSAALPPSCRSRD